MAKSILLVDDSATMLMSVKSILEIGGFKVETSSDGLRALNKLKGGSKPDLIITDINMPNMGGIEFIGKARALPGFRFIPILCLTTESQQAKRDILLDRSEWEGDVACCLPNLQRASAKNINIPNA